MRKNTVILVGLLLLLVTSLVSGEEINQSQHVRRYQRRSFSLAPWRGQSFSSGSSEEGKISGLEERKDCPSPWCDQGAKLYNLSAPNDPSLYLGSLISYENPSDWMSYVPLLIEVQELTNQLTTNQDKAFAIADWLKHSKISGVHHYTCWPASIIDFWDFPIIDCEEASYLLTAMLRLAGIPAMRFISLNEDHAAARFWVNGDWAVADATPLSPDNSGPAHIYAPDDPAFIPGFQERPLLTLSNVVAPGGAVVASFTLFSYEPVVDEKAMNAIGLSYGTIAFPVTNAFVYFDQTIQTFMDSGSLSQSVAIKLYFEAEDGLCLNDKKSWYASPLDFIDPGLGWRTIDPTLGSWVSYTYPNGYIQTFFPTCGWWDIHYYWDDEDLNAGGSGVSIASARVWVGSGSDFVVIRYTDLVPDAGANMYFYNKLVQTLSELPTFEQLGGVWPTQSLHLIRKRLVSPEH